MLLEKSVVNLNAWVNRELLESTRYSQIDAMEWSSSQNAGIIIVSITNGNILCFSHKGQQVRLISEKLYNQAILANRL